MNYGYSNVINGDIQVIYRYLGNTICIVNDVEVFIYAGYRFMGKFSAIDYKEALEKAKEFIDNGYQFSKKNKIGT